MMSGKRFGMKMFVYCVLLLTAVNVVAYDIEAKLKDLKISFEKTEASCPWLIASMGNTKVFVAKECERNQENKVERAIIVIFDLLILTEEQENILIRANSRKTPAQGVWQAEETDMKNGSVYLYFLINIPENATDKQLTEAIIKCSKIVLPFNYDYQKQYTMAIRKVLELDAIAGKKSTREEIVRTMAEINLTLCPEDFINAYKRHFNAWRQSLDCTGMNVGALLGAAAGANNNNDSRAGAVAGFLLGGLIGGGIQEASHSEAIRTTWENVVYIAKKYGVTEW